MSTHPPTHFSLYLPTHPPLLSIYPFTHPPIGYGGVVNVLLLPTNTPLAFRKEKLAGALKLLGLIYTAEPLLTWLYIRHMTRLFSNGVKNLKVGGWVGGWVG